MSYGCLETFRMLRCGFAFATSVLFAGCGGDSAVVAPNPRLLSADASAEEPMRFSDWTAPVSLGEAVNSVWNDQGPTISKDELSLYFVSTRPNAHCAVAPCDNDIWVSRREHKDDPWGEAVSAGDAINTPGLESTPTLSRDGRRLYFASDRPGGVGGIDLWMSERTDAKDDAGWETPVNLGLVNSGAADLGPTFFVDPTTGRAVMYFYSTRPRPDGSLARRDIYRSDADESEVFGPAALVAELSTPFEDEQPSIRRDGLEILFASNRPGSMSSTVTDIWASTRTSTTEPWGEPVTLGSTINTPALEARPSLTFDGRTLYFFSSGLGGLGGTDLFMATRRKGGGKDE